MKLEAIPIAKLASVRSGGGAPQDPSAFTTTGFPFVRAGSLPKLLGGEEEGSLEHLERQVAEQHGLSLFPAGTVLFAKSGMSATKGHVYRLKGPAYVVNHLAALVPHVPEESAFLVRVLQRFSPTTLIKDAAYPSIRLGDIENMKVLAPPDSNGRRRIAEILDNADALRAKRRAALVQLATLTQSIFLDMFGDPATNPKGWPGGELRALGRVSTGGTPPTAKPGMFDGPIPFVTPGDLESEEPVKRSLTAAGADESVTVRPGATLVCCIGATIGKIGKAGSRSAFNQQINAVEWGEAVNDTYGLHVLRFFKPTIVAWGASTTLPILKKSAFERIEVPVPPLALQRDFSQKIAGLERIRSSSRRALGSLDEMFGSLQSRAFRGDL
jgi:type I restriction enzyme S subunit